ncbi:hypothetical protein P0Y35_17185 [Kiritimatiellaeota bacterium B1221]|nr:hypothetical protein [Kiritimatiellaeota bacterium B1221]
MHIPFHAADLQPANKADTAFPARASADRAEIYADLRPTQQSVELPPSPTTTTPTRAVGPTQ